MVTISGFAERESANGKKFYALLLQGGMEMVLSEESGRYYATAKQASIASTFDEATCKAMVGSKLPGRITRVKCDPFDYTIRETGEVISLSHRWAYDPSESVPVEEVVYGKELAAPVADPFAF
jgi:hypothetical protein